MAQTVYIPDPSVLIKDSCLIVQGVAEDLSLVVRPEAIKRRGEFPKASEYVLGFLFRLRVDEVMRNDGKVRKGKSIAMFVPWNSFTHGPTFVKGQRYLVFLTRLKPDKEKFAGAMIHEYGKPTRTRFESEVQYAVVNGEAGVVEDVPKNSKRIEDVRKAVANPL